MTHSTAYQFHLDPAIFPDVKTVRVLVVDDHAAIRLGIRDLLAPQAGIDIVCEAVDGIEAISRAREHKPDLVLMDIAMPLMNGLEATRIISEEMPLCHVVIVSLHYSPWPSERSMACWRNRLQSTAAPVICDTE